MSRQYNKGGYKQSWNNSQQSSKIAELEATINKARTLYKELTGTCKKLQEELKTEQAQAESYKILYLDELQKRLQLAEIVRRLEDNFENQRNCKPGKEERDA